MPRPSKLTDFVADQIVLAVTGASTFKAAARYAGVGETTFYSWLSRGRAERLRLELAAEELEALPKRVRSEKARKARMAAVRAAQPKADELRFLEFAERIEQADGEAQVRAAAQIAAAGARCWRAAAWFLERRDPATWGPPRVRVAVEDETDARLVPVAGIDAGDPEVPRLAHELLARAAGRGPDARAD